MADVLSQITTHPGLEAMQSILDGATLGAAQRTEGEDPAMVEDDQEKKRKYELLLGESLLKCMSLIGLQPKVKTLN